MGEKMTAFTLVMLLIFAALGADRVSVLQREVNILAKDVVDLNAKVYVLENAKK